MLTKFKKPTWLQKVSFVIFVALTTSGIESYAQIDQGKFIWTEATFAVDKLIFGETTRQEVFENVLGPTHLTTGDGGQGASLCYLQKMTNGGVVRVVLSFFGAGDQGVLSTIEWQLLKNSTDTKSTENCKEPTIREISIGMVDGLKIGNSRAEAREVLSMPTKQTGASDEYFRILNKKTSALMSKIVLTYDVHGKIIKMLIQQIETS